MQVVANAVFLTTFYLSFALGLTMIFGVMRVVNYAHGEIFMSGGYVLYVTSLLLRGVAPNGVVLLAAIVAAVAIGAAIGAVIYFGLINRLRDQPFSIFMATLGLSYVLQVGIIKAFGPVGRTIPVLFPGIIRSAGMILPTQRLVVVCLTLLTIGTLWQFLSRSDMGRAIRAAAQNRTGAVLQGINLQRIGLITMLLGSALAAISGVLMGSLLNINPFMGGEAIWRAFIVIIVGGIGSLPGAAIAAVLFGTLDTVFTASGHGELVSMVDALIMLAILSFLPSGLMGAREA
jgi:branched-subunit amino acid ABC-type transport system permease component